MSNFYNKIYITGKVIHKEESEKFYEIMINSPYTIGYPADNLKDTFQGLLCRLTKDIIIKNEALDIDSVKEGDFVQIKGKLITISQTHRIQDITKKTHIIIINITSLIKLNWTDINYFPQNDVVIKGEIVPLSHFILNMKENEDITKQSVVVLFDVITDGWSPNPRFKTNTIINCKVELSKKDQHIYAKISDGKKRKVFIRGVLTSKFYPELRQIKTIVKVKELMFE